MLIDELGSAATAMLDFDAPWGIAGGWAIDLYLDRQTRAHADVDIAILRGDQRKLWSSLHPRVAEYANEGVLRPWHPNAWLALPIAVWEFSLGIYLTFWGFKASPIIAIL